MSVRAISRVLDDSAHGGTELLMLVILADFADDEGNSYPAIATLARKCRTTPRHANRIVKALCSSGELEIRQNEGPRGVNRYRIQLAALGRAKVGSTPDTRVTPDMGVTLTPTSATPDMGVPKPLTSMSDEPSLNRQEPSALSPSAPPPPVSGFAILLNTGVEFQVTQERLTAWIATFPAVDVKQELREMRAWSQANPTRRKTARGVEAFIVRWLQKAQDAPAPYSRATSGAGQNIGLPPGLLGAK